MSMHTLRLQGFLYAILLIGTHLCGRVETVHSVRAFDAFVRENGLVATLFYQEPNTLSSLVSVSKKKPWRGMAYVACNRAQPEAERLMKRYHIQGDALIVFKDGARLATLLMNDATDVDAVISFFVRHQLDDALKKVRVERSQRAWMRRQRLDLTEPSSVVMFGMNVYPDYVYEGAGDYFGPNYYSSYPRPGHVHFGIGFGF